MPAARTPQPDPYELLGIRADASSADVARAYRRHARALHPDSQPADPAAADRFQALTLAYELLSDPDRRAAHDHQRHVSSAAPSAATGAGQAMPPIWPLDVAVTKPPATRPHCCGLSAGPVIIAPVPGTEPDLAGLIRRFLERWERSPW